MTSDMQLNDDQTLADMKIKLAFARMDFIGEQISKAKLDFDFANISTVFLDQYLATVQDAYDDQGEINPMLAMEMMGMVMGSMNCCESASLSTAEPTAANSARIIATVITGMPSSH